MATTQAAVKSIVNQYNITNVNSRGITVTNKSAPLVQELRTKFLQEYEKEKDFYYPEDIQKVIHDDWYIKRFLLARNRDIKESLTMLIDALKWRKSEGVRDLVGSYFPEELFKLSCMFVYAPDREGNISIYFSVQNVFKHPEMVTAMKKFGNYILNITDEETNGAGISIFADFEGCGIHHAESMDLLFHAISTLKNYFPFGISRIVLIDLPWILRACWGMAKAWVPQNRRKLVEFTARADMTKLVAPENLPDFLGGSCTIPYGGDKVVPKGSPTMYKFCTDVLGLSEKCAEKVSNTYKPPADAMDAKQCQKDWYNNCTRLV
jgi:hypothetical protein